MKKIDALTEPHIVSNPNTPEAKALSEEYWTNREKIKPVRASSPYDE